MAHVLQAFGDVLNREQRVLGFAELSGDRKSGTSPLYAYLTFRPDELTMQADGTARPLLDANFRGWLSGSRAPRLDAALDAGQVVLLAPEWSALRTLQTICRVMTKRYLWPPTGKAILVITLPECSQTIGRCVHCWARSWGTHRSGFVFPPTAIRALNGLASAQIRSSAKAKAL